MPKGIAVDKQRRLRERAAMSDTTLLLTITVVVFFILYLAAILFLGGSFAKPQNFLNILNNNASLIVLACGMSIVMITGGIDISVGGVFSSALASAWPSGWSRGILLPIWRFSPSSYPWRACSSPRA